MPVQFYNLGFHVFQADAAAQAQNITNQAARVGAEVQQSQHQDKGREESVATVQDAKEVENREIQGEGRGAHSHTLSSSEEEKKKEDKAKEPPPEDPSGKGRIVDVEA